MPDRMKSALVPATKVPMLPTTRDKARINGIQAATLRIRHSLNASIKTPMATVAADLVLDGVAH